jgi:hypothetical protein
MGLFDKQISKITSYLDLRRNQGKVSESFHSNPVHWPSEKNRNLVLSQDTAVELGNPKEVSTCFLLWTDKPDRLKNGRISVVDPNLPRLVGCQVSFGRVVTVGGSDDGLWKRSFT